MLLGAPRYALVFALVLAAHGCDDPVRAQPLASPPRPAPSPPTAPPTTPSPGPPSTSPPALAPLDSGDVEILTGGAVATDRLPLIVAIHGLGDSPDGLSGLYATLPFRARVILPRGLDPFGAGGWSWFPSGSADRLPREFARARDALREKLRTLTARRPTCGLPVVSGFSQGGMLSYALAVEAPSVVRGAVPISGRLPRAFWPAPRPIGGLLPEVFGLHGTVDDRIPVTAARATVESLRAVGFTVTLREYPNVGHTVTRDMRQDLHDALQRMVGPGGGC